MVPAMERRNFLRVGGTGAVVALAGCTTRVTGWSSLSIFIRNAANQPIRVHVTIDVNGKQAFDRQIDLNSIAHKTIEASVTIPWGATLAFRVARSDTDAVATDEWEASHPLWGGNKCSFEPAIHVDTEGVSLQPMCA